MTRRTVIWGFAAAVVYAGVAVLSFSWGLLPLRPLYDGIGPPPPYNFVNPPPDLAVDNRPPAPGSGTIGFTEEGSEARSVATGDGQAIAIFSMGAVPPREGVESVDVTITPLDPEPLGEPPSFLSYDGNAYRLDLAYEGTDEEPELERPVTLVLRYPVHAEVILRQVPDGWEQLDTDVAPASLQLFADSPSAGTFVAAGLPPEPDRPWIPAVIAALAVLAAIGGYLVGRRPAHGRADRRRQARKASGSKRSKKQPRRRKR